MPKGSTSSVLIRPVQRTDFNDWLPLWDGYNAFYGRSGPTALPLEITETTWRRFFDPAEPVFALVAEDGVITEIIGGRIKEHGVEKLGRINLSEAVVKTGLLRRASVKPRKVKRREKEKKKFRVSFLNHAAEDIYRLHSSDLVVTVGDDTTLVAADILYRFDVPIIGITDGDIDRVVREGFRCLGSLIIEFEGGWDDIVGKKIHEELFRGRDSLETEDVESFKRDLLQIIDNIGASYTIRST